MKKRLFCSGLFLGLVFFSFAQQNAVVKEYLQTFTTYPFSDPDPIPSVTKIYPYFRYDGFTNTPVQKQWKVVELENDYIKVMILPEIGGKIWTAIEKTTNRPFIYYNHAVKFRDVAMRGPWTSGGIEANYGIIGHTPNCATPVDYITKKNDDGSVSCIIGVPDLLTQTNWSIEINLPKDKAYFTTQSFWYNATPQSQPYYHWMNTGLKAKGNLEFIYPGTKYLGHDGEYRDWPVNKNNNKDISWYENNNFGTYKSYHVFGKYTNFFGAYWHNDDFGMARSSDHDDKAGKKIWIWGLSQQGMIWERLLTDTDGQYVEVQSGRLFNQNTEKSSFTPFKHVSFAPHSADTWKEYWFPVLKTKGFKEANEYGAVNIKHEDGWMKIYFCPVQFINDKIEVKEGDKIIYSKNVQLAPLNVFSDSVRLKANEENIELVLGDNKLNYSSQPKANVLNRPVEIPADFDWNTAYGLYIQGKELLDQKLFTQAEDKLNASLQKDHNFLPALVKMAALMYRNIRFEESLALSKKALSIDTHNGEANYWYGLANAALNSITDAKDGFDQATLSLEYRGAAYTELSKLYFKEKIIDKSYEYSLKALDYDRYNIAALQMQAIIDRYKKDKHAADKILSVIQSLTPLNHFVAAEKYLWDAADRNKNDFTSQLRNELPQQTCLELASFYYENNLYADAEKILQLFPVNALINYWIAFLEFKQSKEFKNALEKADNTSPAFVFPFNSNDAEMLQWVMQQNDNWQPKYFLALLYQNRNRAEECHSLLNSLKNIPGYAPFYAFRAALYDEQEAEKTEENLNKAITLDKEQWRYYKLLAEHFIKQKQNEKALTVTATFYNQHPQNYIMGMLYAKTLLLNKKYKEAGRLLNQLTIIPFEGATEGRELYRESQLMQGINALRQKQYKKVLGFITAAKLWPGNLGVGKPYEEDIDYRAEDWMEYLAYQGLSNSDKAGAVLQKILTYHKNNELNNMNNYAANELISAWGIEKSNGKDAATKWLNELVSKDPGNEILHWCQSLFNNSSKELIAPGLSSSARIIYELSKL